MLSIGFWLFHDNPGLLFDNSSKHARVWGNVCVVLGGGVDNFLVGVGSLLPKECNLFLARRLFSDSTGLAAGATSQPGSGRGPLAPSLTRAAYFTWKSGVAGQVWFIFPDI